MTVQPVVTEIKREVCGQKWLFVSLLIFLNLPLVTVLW